MLVSKRVFIIGICLFLAFDLYSGICGAFEFSFEGKATGTYQDHYMAPCRPFRFLNEHLYSIPAILTLPPYVTFQDDLRGDPTHPLPTGLHVSFVGTTLRLLLIGFVCFFVNRSLDRKDKTKKNP
jgi:hypothetical protein